MPTTNPVPSQDPSDLLFNAGKLDEVLNGTGTSFTDRLGVARRTVAGMNSDFDAQLADAESDLNVYRADAAASAAQALGYLNTIRTTSYGAYASDPATDPLGNPPTVGDEYFNTTSNLLKRFNGTTWQASDINTANLAAPSGSSLVGYGTGTVHDKLRETVSVFDKLSVFERADALTGNPALDTSAKIQLAIDEAKAEGKRLTAVGAFRVGAQKIVFKGDADFSQATFHVYGAPPIAVEVSTGSASNPTDIITNAKIWLPKATINKDKPAVGWVGQGIGVRTVNCLSCEIHTGYIGGFKTNLFLTAFGPNGNVYNDYYIGWLDNGQVNLLGQPGDTSSWVNENVFYSGRYSHLSSEGTNVAGTRQIKLAPFDVTNSVATWPDNNLFIKPSVEGAVPEYHVEIGGAFNQILSGRWEAPSPKVLLVGHATQTNNRRNIISGGFQANQIVYTTSGVTQWNGAFAPDTLDIEGSGDVCNISNTSGDSVSYPHVQGFPAGVSPLGKNTSSGDWTYRLHANGLQGKRSTDNAANPRVRIDFSNAFAYFGSGSAPATDGVGYVASGAIGTGSNWVPFTDGTQDLGISSRKWRYLQLTGSVGFFGASVLPSKPAVTGSRGGNAALASLLTVLASYGMITDSTTA